MKKSTGIDLDSSRNTTEFQLFARAITNSDLDTLRKLIASKASVDAKNGQKQTPLEFALTSSRFPAALVLLQAGAKLNASEDYVSKALMTAASAGETELLRVLITAKVDVNTVSKKGNTALSSAIHNNHTLTAQVLIGAGARFDPKADYLHRVLFDVATRGEAPMLRLLMSLKASVDDKKGRSLMDLAQLKGHTEVIDLLLSTRQADPASQALTEQSTALFRAIHDNDDVTIRQLLAAKASINTTNEHGHTPLEYALRLSMIGPAKTLVKAGAHLSTKDPFFTSTLFTAANINDVEMVQMLVDAKADVNVANKNGRTPLDIVLGVGYSSVAQVLLQAGAKMDPNADYVRKAVVNASRKANFPMLRLLAAAKASVDVSASQSNTALQQAIEERLTAAVKPLTEAQPPTKPVKSVSDTKDPVISSLFEAIAEQDTVTLKSLIASKAPIATAKFEGQTPLQFALGRNVHASARVLIDAGVKLELSNESIGNALFSAANSGHAEIIDVLISVKANVNMVNKKGKTPLDVALGMSRAAVTNALLAAGARRSSELKSNAPTAKLSVIDQSAAAFPSLGEYKKDAALMKTMSRVDEEDSVDVASRPMIEEMIRVINDKDNARLQALIAAKAPIDARSSNGETPLEYAMRLSRFSSAVLLLKAGAKLSASAGDLSKAFMTAASAGESEFLSMSITAKVDVNMVNKKGNTALSSAIHNGYPQAAQVLLDAGARFDPDAGYVQRVIATATAEGDHEMLRFLKAAKASVRAADEKPAPVVQVAENQPRNNPVELSKGSLQGNSSGQPQPSTQPKQLLSASQLRDMSALLVDAAAGGSIPTVQQIIAAGVSVDATNTDGLTALFAAIHNRQVRMVDYLIQARADVTSVAKTGILPLSYVAVLGYTDLVTTLIEADAPINAVDKFQQTALYLACQNRHTAVAARLIQEGANINTLVASVGTPLSVAATRGSDEILRLLLDARATVNITNERGETPLHLATRFGHANAVKILLDRGAVPNVRDVDGVSAAAVAVARRQHQILLSLLAAKADARLGDNYGCTPLDLAISMGDVTAVSLLNAVVQQ